MEITEQLSEDDRSYLSFLTADLLSGLKSLVHPYQATVQIEDLSSFLSMIWLDDFNLLFNYFSFDWITSDRIAIETIASQHVELKRSNGYSVPQITDNERLMLTGVIKDLQALNKALYA